MSKKSSKHDVYLSIAADDGSSSGWHFDLQNASEDQIRDFIKNTVSDHVDVLLEEIKKGNNSINILYGR